MACGTGKTLTSLFIKEKLAVERLPSLSLLKQTMQEWTVNRRVPFEPLPVCSDQTVGLSDEDAAVAHTSELGVPVTTDPHEIAAFLRRRSGPRVVFSTYQSSPQIAAGCTSSDGGVDQHIAVVFGCRRHDLTLEKTEREFPDHRHAGVPTTNARCGQCANKADTESMSPTRLRPEPMTQSSTGASVFT